MKLNYFRFLIFVPFLVSVLFSMQTKVKPEFTEPLSPRIANYKIKAKLDTENKLVKGKLVLIWKNTTNFPTAELQFHLYYNAWNNDCSSMFQSVRRRRIASLDHRDNEWAYCRIDSISLIANSGNSTVDLMPTMEFIQPDDGNAEDRTVMRVILPEPVRPGKSVKVMIDWESKIPRTFARTGVRADYYFIAQWFPKVGVFEEDGTWNCHQFIQTEFYADFGVYDVELTVPEGWIVGATGREISFTDNQDGTVTHRYYQEDVHDFAWVAAPYFHEFWENFSEPELPEVQMRLLLMPDHLKLKDRYFAATRAALKYYGLWWGAYPYDHITIVDPAFRSGSGGMEYPTFFTGGARWLSPKASRSPEGVTVHECGHQFWYGMVANNEFEHAWLDEGFNTYSTTRTMEVAFPNPVLIRRYFEWFIPVVYEDIHLTERTAASDSYFGFYSSMKSDRISNLSYKYGPNAYRVNSYGKPARMLRTLENIVGWETFRKIMSTYFDRYKFKHPKPENFFAIVKEITGEDYSWFFNQVYNNSNILDYAVEKVEFRKLSPSMGYAYESGKYIPVKEWSADSSSSDLEDSLKQSRSTFFVHRWGEMILPVEIRVIFSDGDTLTESWDGAERWARFDYFNKTRITAVDIDPNNKLVLDVNHTNNSWVREAPAQKAALKWAVKWLLWLQNLLEFFTFFI